MADEKLFYVREEYCKKFNFTPGTKYKCEEEYQDTETEVFIFRNDQSELVGLQSDFVFLAG